MKLHEHIQRLSIEAKIRKEKYGNADLFANTIIIVLNELEKRLTPCLHCTEGMQEVHKVRGNELQITDVPCEVCNGDYLEGGEDE
jgi:cytidine deaminase